MIGSDDIRVIQSAYFNTTMVQLKAGEHDHFGSPSLDFNTTMVQLKVQGLSPRSLRIGHFNTTMVQLKAFQLVCEYCAWYISIQLWFN